MPAKSITYTDGKGEKYNISYSEELQLKKSDLVFVVDKDIALELKNRY